MKTRLLFATVLALFANFSFSQTIIWSEDFNSGAGNWNLSVPTGVNDVDANIWAVSDAEGGVAPPGCGVALNGDATLHVTCQGGFCIGTGAAYNAGDGGLGFVFATTNIQAELTTPISTVGQTNLTLNFDWIGVGEAGDDECELFWSNDGGGTWNSLNVFNNGATCVGGQGQWANYSVALPVACENQADLRFAFNWVNSNNGAGTDPSFAVNDMELTTPSTGNPVADFTASLTTICEGDCIDFTDASTLGTNPSWSWTFTGAATATSTDQNPLNICYNTAGTYDVSLTVTDDNGNDTETKVGYITVNAPANAGSSTTQNLCNNTTLDLNTLIPGADPGTWVETSGVPSGQFTPGTGVLDGNGLTAGSQYTFDYTVTGNAPCPDVTSTITIDIISCTGTPPVADFSASNVTICAGDCIDFTDLSTVGTNPSWSWSFPGAQTTTSTDQNPMGICYLNPGTYDVTLTVTDDGGMDTETKVAYITVNASPNVTATATPNDTICTGDQVTLTGGGAVSYTWDNGVTDGVAFSPTATTTYTVIGTDANGCTRNAVITVVVENCDPIQAIWGVNSTNICFNDCITFTDSSTGNISTWEWDFGGGGTPNTSTTPSPTICFDSTGTFTVSLTVIGGGDTSTTSQVISVFPGPTVTATLDTLIDLGGSADLIAVGSGPGTYSWDPPEFVDCDTCATTFASPYLNTLYIVTHTDVNGCSATDTVDVMVNFIEGIDVPSAFSPNADGNNDILFVKGIGIESMTFTIYNRYGQKVFESDNQQIGWDGTFRGRPENSGVFTWMLEYRLVNQATGLLKGNTTLIR